MIGFWGRVVEIVEETESRQIMNVHMQHNRGILQVMHYVYADDRCQTGDWVQVNTSAVDLGLGTGGYGFVMGHLAGEALGDGTLVEETLASEHKTAADRRQSGNFYPGHLLKMRYTPQQSPVLCVEAPESEQHPLFQTPFSLQGKGILIGELHSMLPVVAGLVQRWKEGSKLVYIMDDQACLHLGFSHHVRHLKQTMNVRTMTYGQALGGDVETVNLYTALEAAVKVEKADHILITQGPGVLGTGTQRGFSGMQLAQWVHAIHSCGGRAVVIPRIQFADQRERHKGVSHHTLEPLSQHILVETHLPYPQHTAHPTAEDEWLDQQIQTLRSKHELHPVNIAEIKADLEAVIQGYGLPIRTMGRTHAQDPYFFYAIAAAVHFYLRNQS